VLKKAGIVVAGAAATLLAVSPLAFAHDTTTNNNGESSHGLINVSDNSLVVPIQACNNDVPVQGGAGQVQVPVKEVTGALTGALALFGKAESSSIVDSDSSRTCGDNSGAAGDTYTQNID
jgi:hypothetical protein